ncbi:MAG: WS/DGAT/MGAT family O-acyltransferase [Microthrixaceae bacterium]
MDRLSALDAEFLHLEDGVAHMHIAGICTFDGPMPTVADLHELIAAKLHLIPRYRQVVRTVPLELGRPVWVDDPHFHLDYHLRHTALPAPGGRAELETLMGRLMSQPLDRRRPLWEAWLVEGLEDGRWALIFKVHHCMVDGISGVGLLTVLLDLSPDAPLPEPEPWSPEPVPSGAALVLDAWGGALCDAGELAAALPGLATRPGDAAALAGGLAMGAGRLAARLVPGTGSRTPVTGDIGPHRVWAHSTVDFDDVRQIRRHLGGTVNDVILAAVTGGYRDVLLAHEEDPDRCSVRTLVPVSVRGGDAEGVPDNRVSGLLLDLPVEVADPVERLSEVRRRMEALKASHIDEAAVMVERLGNLAPPALVQSATRLGLASQRLLTQRSVTTVTTNVPGPQFPLYCRGRELRSYLPFVPITHGMRIGTAILSYNGRIAFGVTGDLSVEHDVEVLARSVARGIGTLRARAGS